MTFLMRLRVFNDSLELNLSDLRLEAEAECPTAGGFISTTGLLVMSLLSITLSPALLMGEGSWLVKNLCFEVPLTEDMKSRLCALKESASFLIFLIFSVVPKRAPYRGGSSGASLNFSFSAGTGKSLFSCDDSCFSSFFGVY